MILSELWCHYEADKQIQGFSPKTLKAYALQLKMLVKEIGDMDISEITLNNLKEYLAKQSNRLKASSLGHRIRFVRSLFRFAYEETYISVNPSLKLREPKMEKRIPKFLMEEDVIHLKISCQTLRERALWEEKQSQINPVVWNMISNNVEPCYHNNDGLRNQEPKFPFAQLQVESLVIFVRVLDVVIVVDA